MWMSDSSLCLITIYIQRANVRPEFIWETIGSTGHVHIFLLTSLAHWLYLLHAIMRYLFSTHFLVSLFKSAVYHYKKQCSRTHYYKKGRKQFPLNWHGHLWTALYLNGYLHNLLTSLEKSGQIIYLSQQVSRSLNKWQFKFLLSLIDFF